MKASCGNEYVPILRGLEFSYASKRNGVCQKRLIGSNLDRIYRQIAARNG